jgi:3-oxoacyl-[acyl-carrier protein] reductase
MNKTILITGASSDVGLALINSIHQDFDKIIAHYNSNLQQLETLRETIGDKMQLLQADFSSEHDTEYFIKNIENETGVLSHIVHLPASKVRNINFHKSNWAHVETDINISLRSIYKIIRNFIKSMSKVRYGKIVLMLSSYTSSAPKFMLDYITVKYALLGFMKALATEYADKAINFNAVSPSMIETKFLNDVPQLIIEQSAHRNPQKRNAVVDDIVPVIKFLLSDESGYITGENIIISGGSVIGQ